MTLSAFPCNIVRTYPLTPGRRYSFGCRYRLGTGDVRQRGRQRLRARHRHLPRHALAGSLKHGAQNRKAALRSLRRVYPRAAAAVGGHAGPVQHADQVEGESVSVTDLLAGVDASGAVSCAALTATGTVAGATLTSTGAVSGSSLSNNTANAGNFTTVGDVSTVLSSQGDLVDSYDPALKEHRAVCFLEYARSPKLPPLVFEAQACAASRKKDALYVGVDVVRCRRNGLANAPFPLPILCPADGVEPVDGVLPDLGFVEGCCDARQSCLNLLPYVGPGWYLKVSLAAMLGLGVCRWDHIVLGISARSHVVAAARAGAHGRRVAGRGAHGQAQRERDDRPVGAQDGAGADFSQGGHGVGLRLRQEAAEQRRLPSHPRRGPGL